MLPWSTSLSISIVKFVILKKKKNLTYSSSVELNPAEPDSGPLSHKTKEAE